MKPYNKPVELKPLFTERMQSLLGKDFESYLEILEKEPVRSLRCNTLKISVKNLEKRFKEKDWKFKQPFKDYPEVFIIEGKYVRSHSQSNNIINSKIENPDNNKTIKLNNSSKNSSDNKSSAKKSGEADFEANNISSDSELTRGGGRGSGGLQNLAPGELGRSLEHQLGYYYIQELASMLPIIALEPKPEETILDLCSAPGSKTTQAAAKMENTGTIIANEVKFGRIKVLATNLQRCGVTNTIITKKDGIALCKKLAQENTQIDKILVDAPCSGEGTIRSTPKTCHMWNPKTIKNLSKLQKALVSSAIEILKPEGEMIYSTCTHAPEENEEVVDYILTNFPNMKIQKVNLPIKCREGITSWDATGWASDFAKQIRGGGRGRGGTNMTERDRELGGDPIKHSCRIYPQDENTEGFFIAKFKKSAMSVTQGKVKRRKPEVSSR
jgi:NOL1/NOP2/sun family putative RNA methylase